MSTIRRVSLRDDPDTAQELPFHFRIGDEVVINPDGERATVEDAVFDGKMPAGFYTITHHLRRQDGGMIEMELPDLLQFNRS